VPVAALAALLVIALFCAPRAGAATFSNPAAIKMPNGEDFLPYPSVIAVSGQRGKVSRVRVTLRQVAHDNVGEVAALLASPTGASALLLYSRCNGQNSETAPLTFTFDDAAPAALPSSGPCVSGTYRTGSGIESGFDVQFAYPAPAQPNPGTFAGLTGSSPNGLWQLYMHDSVFFVAGEIAGGWSLDLTLTKPKCKKAKGKRAVAAKKKRCKKKRKKG